MLITYDFPGPGPSQSNKIFLHSNQRFSLTTSILSKKGMDGIPEQTVGMLCSEFKSLLAKMLWEIQALVKCHLMPCLSWRIYDAKNTCC